MHEKPGFPAHSRVSWEAWPDAGMRGCLGRDRTPTLPFMFRPLKSLRNFGSIRRFVVLETFEAFPSLIGSSETRVHSGGDRRLSLLVYSSRGMSRDNAERS